MNRVWAIRATQLVGIFCIAIVQFAFFPLHIGTIATNMHILLVVALVCLVMHRYTEAILLGVLFAFLQDTYGTSFFGLTFMSVAIAFFVQLLMQEYILKNKAFHAYGATMSLACLAYIVTSYLIMAILEPTLFAGVYLRSLLWTGIADIGLCIIAARLIAITNLSERHLFYER